MNEKRIKILTGGLINVPGFLYGPILTPYMEKLSVIYRLVSSGITVVEVCNDGHEVILTRDNYAEDNNTVEKTDNSNPSHNTATEETVNEIKTNETTETTVVNTVVDENDDESKTETVTTDVECDETPEETSDNEDTTIVIDSDTDDETPEETDNETVIEPSSVNSTSGVEHANYSYLNNHNKKNKKRR